MAVLIGPLIPITAIADVDVGEKRNGLSACEETYLARYAEAHREFGSGTVGANLVDDGTGKHEPYSLPESLTCQKAGVLGNMLRPPEPPEIQPEISAEISGETAYTEPTYAAPSSSGGCPASMAPESGAAGYDAYNPASGAQGCYQVIPSTAAAHNCDLSTPAGQDACAAAICATQGPSAWSASGANPC